MTSRQRSNYLKFSSDGLNDGELIFVSGSPGKTDLQRLWLRWPICAIAIPPYVLNMFYRREALESPYSAVHSRTREKRARTCSAFKTIANATMVIWLDCLTRKSGRRLRGARENCATRLEAMRNSSPHSLLTTGSSVRRLRLRRTRRCTITSSRNGPVTVGYRGPRAFSGDLFKYARLLLRAADERVKPNGERIPTFRDSARESLELELFSNEPIHDDYDILRLTDSLSDFTAAFGADSPLVKKVLTGKCRMRAQLSVQEQNSRTRLSGRLSTAKTRRAAGAHDPMIDLASMIDAQAREARKTFNAQDEIKKQAYADIAKARFAIEGASGYPDATFTLRLSYGTVRGYEQDGKQIPAFTDIAGLYQRAAEHDNRPPFDLPKRWLDKKTDLNLATRYNFVSDADIIGGNSGSPVVNKANEFVGIIFDGNIQSLVADCTYTDTQSRAVSVDSAAIIEALRKVYDASALADELQSATR